MTGRYGECEFASSKINQEKTINTKYYTPSKKGKKEKKHYM